MQLSAKESKAYDALRGNKLNIFRTSDLSTLLGANRTKTYNILKALKRKGIIEPLKNGIYAFTDVSDYAMGARLNWPSYVSFRSALNYYGFTDNAPRKISYVSSMYRRETDDYRYVVFSAKRFFGYVSVGDIPIAEPEKAIVDSLLFPRYSGGIPELRRCLENGLGSMSVKRLVDYSLRVDSKVVCRRLGLLLEGIGGDERELKRLIKNIGKGYGLLDPTQEKANEFDKKWLLDINSK
jgi:predicted transcriptional regulator of viral defense system